MAKELLKSPMNYIGNKYRILNQILPLFPESNTMVDLFAGGLDVAINYNANKIYCNDINYHLIEIYEEFQKKSYDEIVDYLHFMIDEYSLSKTNEEAFLEFRDYYNNSDRKPLDLYLLMNYSFNYQFRFNSNHEYNNPFGKERSSFNASLEKRLEEFVERIKDFEFSHVDYKDFDYSVLNKGDFIYCDPPYTISTGSYNDGKRGFKGWTSEDDVRLLEILDKLSNRGVKFALSNVVEHKGTKNEILLEWAKKYKVFEINCKYDNCNYHADNRRYLTKEVLITNE